MVQAEERGHHRWVPVIRAVELVVETARQLASQQSLHMAASLSFTTILSVVPVMAVSFAVFRAFVTSGEIANTVQKWLLSTLLADSVSEVTTVIEELLARASGGAVGAVGTVFLLVTALSLFLSIETSFNSIWRVPLSRPLHRRLTTFYSVLTLTPALIGVGVFFAESVRGTLVGSVGGLIGAGALSFVMTVLGLTLMYKLLPHTLVRWPVAFAGALGAGIALGLTRWGFNHYMSAVYAGSVQSKIYGTLALVPVFALWVYITWVIVLGGNILAYHVQHRDTLTRALLRRRRRQDEPAPPNGYLLARVFLLIARHFRFHGGGLSAELVAARLQIEANEVNPAVRALVEGGLLLEASGKGGMELVPSRPLDRIELHEMYGVAEAAGYHPGQLPGAEFERLERTLAAADGARRGVLGVSVAAMVEVGVVEVVGSGVASHEGEGGGDGEHSDDDEDDGMKHGGQ